MKSVPFIESARQTKFAQRLTKRIARKLAHQIAKSEVSHTESERDIYRRIRGEVTR